MALAACGSPRPDASWSDVAAAPFLAAMRSDENESVRMASERALDEVRP